MNKIVVVLLCLLLTAACSSERKAESETPCGDPSAPAGVQTLSPLEAAALIQERPDLLVLDVRTPEEMQEGAIERSILTPFWSLVQGTMTLPKDRPLLLVCAVGSQSHAAGQLLVRNGYPEVYHIQGGMVAWSHAGLPLRRH